MREECQGDVAAGVRYHGVWYPASGARLHGPLPPGVREERADPDPCRDPGPLLVRRGVPASVAFFGSQNAARTLYVRDPLDSLPAVRGHPLHMLVYGSPDAPRAEVTSLSGRGWAVPVRGSSARATLAALGREGAGDLGSRRNVARTTPARWTRQ